MPPKPQEDSTVDGLHQTDTSQGRTREPTTFDIDSQTRRKRQTSTGIDDKNEELNRRTSYNKKMSNSSLLQAEDDDPVRRQRDAQLGSLL